MLPMSKRLYWWIAVAILGIFAYLYALDGMHIPSTGDEGPYLQITRLTATTGHWLPLQPAEGLGVTKPPLLFWQGIIATNWGKHWELWRFRLPIVLYTFLTAWMIFWFTRKISNDSESAAIASVAFLAFTAIFHHGRPYITNLPEVFFLSLSYFLLLLHHQKNFSRKLIFWMGLGLFVGLSAWVRSIFLLAPTGLAFSLLLLWQRNWNLPEFIRKDVLRLSVFTLTVVAVFAFWFVIDPNPQAIVREFLFGENVSKLKTDGYWNNFFSGPYPVFAVWFGIFRNAGFLALPLLYVVVLNFRNRKQLHPQEYALWIWILAFIIVFTVPAQRQDSYILATMPAVAVILGLHWREIKPVWFRVFLLPLILVLAGLIYLMIPISLHVFPAGAYSFWHFVAPAAGMTMILASLIQPQWAPRLFIPVIFTAFISLASVVAPLEGPLGRFSAETISQVKNKTVYVPSNFRSQYEKYRFLLPGAEISSYEETDITKRDQLLRDGEWVIIEVAPEITNFESYKTAGERLTIRNRMPPEDANRVLFEQRMELLFRRELLLQGK